MTTRDVVSIGGSLAGLDVVCPHVSFLPSDFPAAALIVLHTAPSRLRLLAHIVGKFTIVQVDYEEDGDAVEKGHILSPDVRSARPCICGPQSVTCFMTCHRPWSVLCPFASS